MFDLVLSVGCCCTALPDALALVWDSDDWVSVDLVDAADGAGTEAGAATADLTSRVGFRSSCVLLPLPSLFDLKCDCCLPPPLPFSLPDVMMLLPELPLRIELCLFPALLLEEVVEPPSLSLLLVSLLSSFLSLEGSLYKLTVPLWTTKIRAADPFMSPILVISFPVNQGKMGTLEEGPCLCVQIKSLEWEWKMELENWTYLLHRQSGRKFLPAERVE